MELDPRIKDALIKIDFIKRYEELSARFNAERTPSEERLRYIDGGEVMEMIRNLGYIPSFDAREKFYKIRDEQVGKFTARVHIILGYGMVELVWVVRENDELLLGAPWSVCARRLVDVNYRIKNPVVGTYEDIEEVLKVSFEMYEDFKNALIDNQGK